MLPRPSCPVATATGRVGTKAIKQRGGLTMAQVRDGHGPTHPDMPQTAIATGFIDLAVPAAEMGPKLVDFVRSLDLLDRMTEGADAQHGTPGALDEVRLEICAILRTQLGHDFSGYKPKTFLRRVQRRMQVAQAGDDRGLSGPASGRSDRGRRAVPRPADQRHQLLP